MKTVSDCVDTIILQTPYLEEALFKEIINYSALANYLVPEVSLLLKKEAKPGAIMMALRRYKRPSHLSNSIKLKKVFEELGDITVRSNLCDFTFENSKTLILKHTKILDHIKFNNQMFYAFTRGVFESNVIISNQLKTKVLSWFSDENHIGFQDKLSAITVGLPKGNSGVSGLYYQIFKQLAWENISLYEVVSTTNEFTILVEDHLVDRAFSVIKNLKNQ